MGMAAADVARKTISFDGLVAHGQQLIWLESDVNGPQLFSWNESDGVVTLGVSASSELHAYGGGVIASNRQDLWYVKDGDGQMWRLGGSKPLTTEDRALGDLSVVGQDLIVVREGQSSDDLVAFDTRTGAGRSLVTAPFLSSPRWHDGQLAWISWHADTMPWDSSALWVADWDGSGPVGEPSLIAGGGEESVAEPRWSPDGVMHFISDRSGWWNLYRWISGRGVEAVAPLNGECGAAPWEHGYSSYAFLPDRTIALIVQNGPRHRLMTIDPTGLVVEIQTPYTMIKPYLAVVGSQVALIGASPALPQQLALVSPALANQPTVLRQAADAPNRADITVPERLVCRAGALPIEISFYPARTEHPAGTIVRAHPGPTYQSELRLDWETQYWIGNGFAVADVDYRGSTGFGRAFRTALNHHWGHADVDDCIEAAKLLAASGKADLGTLIIFGASAGGYTALRAAAAADSPFCLAVARSPIVNPSSWVRTAPRFQQAHAATLLSPEATVDAKMVDVPIAIVHGSDDPVAPVGDVRSLVQSLRDEHKNVKFLELRDVGHFPAGAALTQTLEFELAAFQAATRS